MSTSRRSRIVLPLVSIVTAFALSAQAEEQNQPPSGAGRRASRRSRRPARVPPRTGQAAQAVGRRTDATREAVCRSAILADTSIMAARPGRVDAGVMRPTTDDTAGGGMSVASGISIRNRWKDRPLMCLTWRSWTITADRMDRRSAPVIHRRRWPMLRRRRHRLRRTRPQARSAAPSSAGCWAASSPDDRAARSPARSPAARSAPSQARRPPRDPAIIWRKAIATYRYPSGQYVQVDPRSCY